jgi:hypothetical protein
LVLVYYTNTGSLLHLLLLLCYSTTRVVPMLQKLELECCRLTRL